MPKSTREVKGRRLTALNTDCRDAAGEPCSTDACTVESHDHNPYSGKRSVSFSELDTARQCRLKHDLSYLRRWVPPGEAKPLVVGKLGHACLQAHFERIREFQRAGEKPDAAGLYAAVSPLLYDRETGEQSEDQALIEQCYKDFVATYGSDDQWVILEVEKKYAVPLPGIGGASSRFVVKGVIDLVVRDREIGGIWVVDHKFLRDIPKGRETDLDDQFGMYPWMMRQDGMAGKRELRGYGLKEGEILPNGGFNVRGAVHNAIRKSRLKTRELAADEMFKRTWTNRTEEEMETLAREAGETFRDLYRQAEEMELAGSKPPRSPNPDTCRWKCSLTEPCLMSRKGLNMDTMLAELGYVQRFERH